MRVKKFTWVVSGTEKLLLYFDGEQIARKETKVDIQFQMVDMSQLQHKAAI